MAVRRGVFVGLEGGERVRCRECRGRQVGQERLVLLRCPRHALVEQLPMDVAVYLLFWGRGDLDAPTRRTARTLAGNNP